MEALAEVKSSVPYGSKADGADSNQVLACLAELNDQVALVAILMGAQPASARWPTPAPPKGGDDGDLVDMVELTEAARLWALECADL